MMNIFLPHILNLKALPSSSYFTADAVDTLFLYVSILNLNLTSFWDFYFILIIVTFVQTMPSSNSSNVTILLLRYYIILCNN